MATGNFNKLLVSSLTALFIFSGCFVFAEELPQLSQEVVSAVPQEDLVEVFCLMTKWKSGEFFAALDSLNEVLIPALAELKAVNIQSARPDIAGIKAGAQQRLEAVCSASNYEDARSAAQTLIDFGASSRNELMSLNSSLGTNLRTAGQEMRDRVKGEIDAWVAQEKTAIEQELQIEADRLGDQLKTQLESEMSAKGFTKKAEADSYAQMRAQQIKTTIDAQMQTLAEQKKAQAQQRLNERVSGSLGIDIEGLQALGEKMENIESLIQSSIAAKKEAYDKYRVQAMAKRAELIAAVLDQKISDAAAQIMAQDKFLKEAKLNDPTIKSAQDYIDELEADKMVLIGKINIAVDSGDEVSLNNAIAEMKDKWLGIREKLEQDLAKRQSPSEICSQALPSITQAKPQVINGLNQIKAALQEIELKKQACARGEHPACVKAQALYDQILSAQVKTEALLKNMESAETQCSGVASDTQLTAEFLGSMIDLRNQGPQWQKEIMILKDQWLLDKSVIEKIK